MGLKLLVKLRWTGLEAWNALRIASDRRSGTGCIGQDCVSSLGNVNCRYLSAQALVFTFVDEARLEKVRTGLEGTFF
jgi:hypothetical protein